MSYPNGDEIRKIMAQAPSREQIDRAMQEALRAPTSEQIRRALQSKVPTADQMNHALRSKYPTAEQIDAIFKQATQRPTAEQIDRIVQQATQRPTAEQIDRIVQQATQRPTAEQIDRILRQGIRLPSADQIAESLKNATRAPSTEVLQAAWSSVFSATKLAELAKQGLADKAVDADFSVLGQALKTPSEEWVNALDEAFPVDESDPDHYDELFQTIVEHYHAEEEVQRAKRSLRERAPWLTGTVR